MFRGLVAVALVAAVSGVELTSENWDQHTAGKSVFLKFYAPWCGHCKALKPTWDKLMEAFEGSPTSLVADVDCTAGGQELCSKNGVQGYPTLKWGTADELKDYSGGRDFDALKKFADENLGPQCGPDNLDLCPDDIKKKITDFMALSLGRVEGKARNIEKQFKEDLPILKMVAAAKKQKGDEL